MYSIPQMLIWLYVRILYNVSRRREYYKARERRPETMLVQLTTPVDGLGGGHACADERDDERWVSGRAERDVETDR
jgi:hypothetical protein